MLSSNLRQVTARVVIVNHLVGRELLTVLYVWSVRVERHLEVGTARATHSTLRLPCRKNSIGYKAMGTCRYSSPRQCLRSLNNTNHGLRSTRLLDPVPETSSIRWCYVTADCVGNCSHLFVGEREVSRDVFARIYYLKFTGTKFSIH